MDGKPKISNTEWGLVIGALAMVDAAQIILDFFAIGAIINRFIDIFVGLCLGFYLQIRGQSLANPKRLIGLIATFAGEEIPVADALPFWVADGIYNWFLAKSEKVLEKTPGGKIVNNVVSITQGKRPQKSTSVSSDDEQKAA